MQGRASARALSANGRSKNRNISRVVLNHFRLIVEGHQERHVPIAADDAAQEIDRGVLFEFQPGADAVRSIEQQANAKGEIRLASEEADLLRRAILQNPEIILLEIRDEIVAAIGDRGDKMDQADGRPDSGDLIRLLWLPRLRLRLCSRWRGVWRHYSGRGLLSKRAAATEGKQDRECNLRAHVSHERNYRNSFKAASIDCGEMFAAKPRFFRYVTRSCGSAA